MQPPPSLRGQRPGATRRRLETQRRSLMTLDLVLPQLSHELARLVGLARSAGSDADDLRPIATARLAMLVERCRSAASHLGAGELANDWRKLAALLSGLLTATTANALEAAELLAAEEACARLAQLVGQELATRQTTLYSTSLTTWV